MMASFKIAGKGSRPGGPPYTATDEASASIPVPALASKGSAEEAPFLGLHDGIDNLSVLSATNEINQLLKEHESSFCLKLFPDGFSIGKPTQGTLLPLRESRPNMLHPYDRKSKTLFTEIEHGWLPRDIPDDIAGEFINGCVLCEMESDGYKLEDDQIQSTPVGDPDLSDSTSVHSFSQEFAEPWYRCMWIQNMRTNQDPPCSCSVSSFPSQGIKKRLHDGVDGFFEDCDDDGFFEDCDGDACG